MKDNPTTHRSQPWQPRPKRKRRHVLVGAVFVAGLALSAFSVYLAVDSEIQRRQFDAVMADLDRARVTEEEIRIARRGEEIAFQLRRPEPAGITVPVTYYSEEYRGRTMANGQPFDPDAYTCAHRTIKLGTMVEFSRGGKTVLLPVTDRGPYDKHDDGRYRKEFDLSAAAFRVLSPDMSGGEGLLVRVRVVR